MGLADEIYERTKGGHGGGDHAVDELGISYWDKPDYFVARALRIQYLKQLKNPKLGATNGIYTFRGDLYLNHQLLQETTSNFYEITRWHQIVPLPMQKMFWVRLKEIAPWVEPSIIELNKDAYWDTREGKWLNHDEAVTAAYARKA